MGSHIACHCGIERTGRATVHARGWCNGAESFPRKLVSLQAMEVRSVLGQLVVISLLGACSRAPARIATPTVTTTGHQLPAATAELIKGTADYPICIDLELIAGTIDSHGHLSDATKTRLALTYETSRKSPPDGADDTLKAVLPSSNMDVAHLRTAVAYCTSLGLYSS